MIDFNTFIETTRMLIHSPLPGLEAQMRMAGIRRILQQESIPTPENANRAGVLLFFYPVSEEPHLVFMKRTEDGGVHSGQISFPGGRAEKSDPDIIFTALREANEEVGIPTDKVQVIGKLTDLYIPPSGFLVTPVVGFSTSRPSFKADPSEVAEIIELPMASFLEKNARTIAKIYINEGLQFDAPCFNIRGNIIWGATAMILNELLEML